MRKIVAGINMTLDAVADHTAVDPDEEIHQHYTDLLTGADAILYGRKTYQLMGFWQTLIENPSGEKEMDDFAMAIDKIPKIVFSHTLKASDPSVKGWDTAKLSTQTPAEVVTELKKQPGRDILVGSRSLIMQLMNLDLIDEYQICVHPVIAGKGSALFDNVSNRIILELLKTKVFPSRAIILYYKSA